MLISDGSSDVCSSDLTASAVCPAYPAVAESGAEHRLQRSANRPGFQPEICKRFADQLQCPAHQRRTFSLAEHRRRPAGCSSRSGRRRRSEEHTSELQSLMRISYAVFCLKKKTTICKLSYISHIVQ